MLRKILPYLITIVLVVVAVKVIDYFTETDSDDLALERDKLEQEIEEWKELYKEADQDRKEVRKENVQLKEKLLKDEMENDSIIDIIRGAQRDNDYAKLDSIGAALEARLRTRR